MPGGFSFSYIVDLANLVLPITNARANATHARIQSHPYMLNGEMRVMYCGTGSGIRFKTHFWSIIQGVENHTLLMDPERERET